METVFERNHKEKLGIDVERIADSLEKISDALDKQNELKQKELELLDYYIKFKVQKYQNSLRLEERVR